MGVLTRRRSFLLKLVVIVSTAWFTIAFLLYSEDRTSHLLQRSPPSNTGGSSGGNGAGLAALPLVADDVVNNDFNDLLANANGGNGPGGKDLEADKGKAPKKVVPPFGKKRDRLSEKLKAKENEGDQELGFIPAPQSIAGVGELGKPVVLPANLTADVKKMVDDGWLKNAFNQYVSDMISVHRTLPDPRDEW